jgi:hypothetical protein
MLKTFLKSRKEGSERISVEKYNQELNEADAEEMVETAYQIVWAKRSTKQLKKAYKYGAAGKLINSVS